MKIWIGLIGTYVRKKNWPKAGKFFTVCFGPLSQSIERSRLNREGALDVRESLERRDKIVPTFRRGTFYFRPKKTGIKRHSNLFGRKFSLLF